MTESKGQLAGKTALITGATSGIGLSMARLFVEEGARVAVIARKGTDDVAKSLSGSHLGVDCDLTKVDDIKRMAAYVQGAFGSLDILCANAGTAFFRRLEDWSEDDFDRMFAVNVKGMFFTVQACAPFMRDGGVIVLTGSIANKLGQPNMALYSASKAAAPALAKALSADLLDRNIRAVCLTPGPVDTPIFQKGGLGPDQAREMLANVGERVPIGRVGQADEIAQAALFLASDQSSFMLGTEIVVDGGKSQL